MKESILTVATCVTMCVLANLLRATPFAAQFSIFFVVGVCVRIATGIGRDPRP